MHLTLYLMTFTLKYEHVSENEGAPDGSSEDTLTFEVKIKGALDVTTELHLTIHRVVQLLMQKSSQNNSIKGILEESLYHALESAPKISLSEARNIATKCEEKDAFDVAVDGSLDDAIKAKL